MCESETPEICDDGDDNDGDGYTDCADFDCDGDPACDPGEWTCSESFYGTNDGCDCGCGIVDPDCGSSSSAVCVYCDNGGSCASSCDDIDPTDNSQCN